MPAQLSGQVSVVREVVRNKSCEFVRQLRACRECGEQAGFFDEICRHCGAGNPVKIPISAGVLITAVIAQAVIVFIRVM